MGRTEAGITRRSVLAGLLGTLGGGMIARADESLPPVRALTRGPRFHWFGYYDKLEFDPTSRYVLGMEAGFEHRSPRPDDRIGLGMVDLRDGDRWVPLGESRAWCWQQGCMLQWVPGSADEVIWNDREGDRFVSRILNVHTRESRTLPAPVYALSPDGRWAVAPDFRRLHDTRPGYGYAGVPDPNRDDPAPDDAGIWRLDLKSGRHELLFSFRQISKLPYRSGEPKGAKHWFNHLLVSPAGSRFTFLHRWRLPGSQGFITRLITCNPDGSDLYVLDPHEKTSHFIWRDPKHILAWAFHPSHGERFYLYEDRTDRVSVVAPAVMTENGHCTYLPGNRWVLNDTYPDRSRLQHPYLYDTQTGRRVPLGHFLSPKEYTGEWRCDTHPRFSPDGKSVVIDSPHGGNGRQLYLIDVSEIVA
ncbi:MAG: hypothetical protein U0835_22720 [Isosphaeraceae bacterium]